MYQNYPLALFSFIHKILSLSMVFIPELKMHMNEANYVLIQITSNKTRMQ